LGVKVAGDHTDIKALMKNYPSYKKNFLRIQLISDKLNEFKGKKFDKKIIALAAQAKTANLGKLRLGKILRRNERITEKI
jgi:hypothetical protein